MGWLHTWAGVVLGMLLFAVFWTGTLIVFDREIDRWMIPSSRLPFTGAPASIDALRGELAKVPPQVPSWIVLPPTAREPSLRAGYFLGPGNLVRMYYDPATLQPLPKPESQAGSLFLFQLHDSLHIKLWGIGNWLVGLAGMAMLALCTSGVVIHRRIFTDFFTLRLSRRPQRLILDLHSTAGTIGLLFYVVMAFSGLTIFAATYFPSAWQAAFKGDRQTFFSETYDAFMRPRLGKPAPLAAVDPMVAQATREWHGVPPMMVRVWWPGDANAFVEMRPSVEDGVTMRTDPIYFDGVTGAVLHRSTMRPMTAVQQFVTGIHFVQFRHWTLRWLYFLLGLLGCTLIVTGLLFWIEQRRKSHAAAGLPGVRLVEGLAVGGTTGLVTATLTYFVANRLLPSGVVLLGMERPALEALAFWLAWAGSFLHAGLRPAGAWIEQCGVIAGLAVAAVVLNAITTGDHLLRTVVEGSRAVAGVDLVLLLGAAAAAHAARRLRTRHRRAAGQSDRDASSAAPP